MGDNLCCCGVDGLGWNVNTANLNHILYDKNSVNVTPAMHQTGTAMVFKATVQNALSCRGLKNLSFIETMQLSSTDFSRISALISDEQRDALKAKLQVQRK